MSTGAEPLRPEERRRSRRYRVQGTVCAEGPGGNVSGELLDIGSGGVLLKAAEAPPAGAELQLEFIVNGRPELYRAPGRVVRVQVDVVAIMFLRRIPELEPLLMSLEEEERAAASAFLRARGGSD
jgi:hypothetical protein